MIWLIAVGLAACGGGEASTGDTGGAEGSTSDAEATTGEPPATSDPTSGPGTTGSEGGETSTGTPGTTGLPTGDSSTGEPVPFELTSTAFAEGEMIPLAYECGAPAPVTGPGDNLTPPLLWTPGPAGTLSYAVVMHDIDATTPAYPDGIIHWVIYDIPADVFSLPEGIAAGYEVADPRGAKQTNMQESGFYGYFGPCSPASVNTYVLTVHAMETATLPEVSMSSTEIEVAALIESTSIASASLSGES